MIDRNILNEDTHDSVVPDGAKHWKDYMWELTPVEQKSDGMFYKREDKFALLGINSLNGSKCRQLLHLFESRPEGVDTVVHATNVNASPQTPMTAAMAEHYSLNCIQVAGGTSFDAINKHQLPLFATMFGTKYEIATGSGFNVNIQKRVGEVMKKFPRSFTIERDITLDHKLPQNTPEMIREFHKVGAHQTQNIPISVTDLIIPFGSANSATSILYGLSNDRETLPKKLERIHLVNVGVDKRKYMFERLALMGADVSMYEFIWHDTKQPYSKTIKGVKVDDITFHYRYEAKVYQYLLEQHPELINENSLFWVIGSVPDMATTAKNLKREVPTEVKVYTYEETFDDIDVDEDLEYITENHTFDEWFSEPEEKVWDTSYSEKNIQREPTLYYVKGGNGAGKSTIPHMMLKTDPGTYRVKSKHFKKVLFTVFPSYSMISLGNYEEGKTFGGCDGLVKEEIMYALHTLKDRYLKFDIFLEGSMPSDTIGTYFEHLKTYTDRKPVVLFLSTTYAEALDRIQARTGKTDEQMADLKNVEKKYIRLGRAKEAYREQHPEDLGIQLLELDTSGSIEEVFERFVTKDLNDITLGDVCNA